MNTVEKTIFWTLVVLGFLVFLYWLLPSSMFMRVKENQTCFNQKLMMQFHTTERCINQ